MRRPRITIAELAVALLWELCHEWGLHPRRIIHARGVRWTGESNINTPGWTRIYP